MIANVDACNLCSFVRVWIMQSHLDRACSSSLVRSCGSRILLLFRHTKSRQAVLSHASNSSNTPNSQSSYSSDHSNSSKRSSGRSRSSSSSRYQQGLQCLVEWQKQYGNCYVPRTATDTKGLELWVSDIRKAAKAGQLSEVQQQELSNLGFVWKPNVVRLLIWNVFSKLYIL